MYIIIVIIIINSIYFLNVLVVLQFTLLSDCELHCLTILLPKKYFLTSNLILLMSPSITGLQNLLSACQELLDSVDMVIDTKKSRCMRIRPRYDKSCANIVTSDSQVISWVDEVRYLGVYIVKFNRFRCSVEYAERYFYRAANGILGKVGRLASEEVELQLLRMKCIPILIYGLDVCAKHKRSLQ